MGGNEFIYDYFTTVLLSPVNYYHVRCRCLLENNVTPAQAQGTDLLNRNSNPHATVGCFYVAGFEFDFL